MTDIFVAPTESDAAQDSAHAEHEALPRVFYASAMLIIAGFILWIGKSILIPLVIATFLSFLIVTLKNLIHRSPGIGKYLPNWLGFALAFGVIALLLIGLIDVIRNNTTQMIDQAPQYTAGLSEAYKVLVAKIGDMPFVGDEFKSGLADIGDTAIGAIPRILPNIGSLVSGFATNLITILLYTIFLLIERGKVVHKIGLLATGSNGRAATDEVLNNIGDLVRQYISIKTVMAVIVSLISYVIMIVLGINFAGFFALMIFALNFVPIIGSAIGITAPVLLAIVQPEGGGVQLALIALITLLGVEQIASSVIEPRLMGKSLNLSPLVILLSLSLWGTLWGFAGMLLCVPITVAILIILSQFHTSRPLAILISDNGDISPIRRHTHIEPATDTEITNDTDA